MTDPAKNQNDYIKSIEKDACEFSDKIITVSDYTKNLLQERYLANPDKIFVAHNGVSENEESENFECQETSIDDPIVLFLGRITYQKGPDYFIQAAAKIIREVPNVRFVMAGTGDLHHRMIELSADLGIGKHFHYTGYLNKESAHRLYEISDLYIMPSVSEPFGLTALEAMSHNLPVILSNQSGVSEVVNQCLKVNFWDTEELAAKTIALLKNRMLRDLMGQEAKKDASKLTWHNNAKKIEEVYRRKV